MKHKLSIWLIILLTIPLLSFVLQSGSHQIKLTQNVRVLKNGKKIENISEVFYDYSKGTMIMHQTEPFEHYLYTDAKGEIKIYYPEKNEVYLSRDPNKITDQSILFYFFSNRLYDFGIRDMGFTVSKTEIKDKYVVTWWKAPNESMPIKQIEIVHDADLPIYMAYYNHNDEIIQKNYYYDYNKKGEVPVQVPQKILEISYISPKDSIITQTISTDIKYGLEASSKISQFKIPLNAKIIRN